MAEDRSGPRIAVLDSGIRPDDPGVRGRGRIEPGCILDDDGAAVAATRPTDRLGHGTAVAAAILDLCPGAVLLPVVVFRDRADCPFGRVVAALELALDWRPDLVNLSLGTTDPSWRDILEHVVERGRDQGVRIVAPGSLSGLPCHPGWLPGVEAVLDDANLPRQVVERRRSGGRDYWAASPHGPGRATGISIATANVTGFLARRVGR